VQKAPIARGIIRINRCLTLIIKNATLASATAPVSKAVATMAPKSTATMAPDSSPPPPPLATSLVDDPLLDLLIATEDPVCDEETLLRLARYIRLVGEAPAPVPAPAGRPRADIDPDFLGRLALENLEHGAPLESTAKDPESPRRQYFVESSDNDVCASTYFQMGFVVLASPNFN
jgi:hypothetical protein